MSRSGQSKTRPVTKPAQRNRLARRAALDRARAEEVARDVPPAVALGRGAEAAEGLPMLVARGLGVWRHDKSLIALVLLPFLIAAAAAFAPHDMLRPSVAELIARVRPTAITARGYASTAPATTTSDLPHRSQPGGDALQAESKRQASAARMAVENVPGSSGVGTIMVTVLASVAPESEARSVSPSDLVASIERESSDEGGRVRACSMEEATDLNLDPSGRQEATDMPGDAEFGDAVAAAAEAQTGDLVIYTDGYKKLSFPMGDVAALYGVCTDVVIRAFRAVGVDLQAAVKEAGVGSGDQSIDHRRTEVLRRYFAKRGASLPPSSVADDYLPGDVVTYHRPQNSGSQSHIAIVSNRYSRSGRPMIVHNRGWGPQVEDALFVDRITGHYRFRRDMAASSSDADAETSGAGTEASKAPVKVTIKRPPRSRHAYRGKFAVRGVMTGNAARRNQSKSPSLQ